MQLFSPPKLQFPHFQSRSPIANPSTPFKPQSPLLRFPPRSSPASLQQQLLQEEAAEVNGVKGESFNELLIVRRPVKEEYAAVEEEEDTSGSLREADGGGDGDKVRGEGDPLAEDSSGINSGLNEFAKKMPMFEPLERVGVAGAEEKPLPVNLELALYRAKVLGRSFRFKEAQKILRKCIFFWPEDGRAYVALGKILGKQSKYAEARVVYESGCQATQGENPYVWQCWAVLENKLGNIRRARELFDAATVADKKHVAAWHGWAVLEIKEGNIKKARSLLGKGLKFCGGNEYIYQTLALLEAKANRIDQARYLFQRATVCNPKSCASWLAWAQLEMQQENKNFARKLFEKAVQASPKNRFAWHVWAMFEASQGDIDQGRKLLKIGHTLNPRDPVLLQSLALLEYRHSTANLARVLFRRASELDPRHQPVWMAWGWMEWKEGNISTARELYQKTISIDSTSETAARCLQAWGVLEQRLGNLTAARRLFRSSLNINSQSYITWMTWASLEEEQGNAIRAEEIRNLYFQQRTEVVDDASWVMGFLDIIDPAVDSIKRLLNLDQKADLKGQTVLGNIQEISSESIRDLKDKVQEFSNGPIGDAAVPSYSNGIDVEASEENLTEVDISKTGDETMESLIPTTEFDLDAFIMEKLSINASDLDPTTDTSPRKIVSSKRTWKSQHRTAPAQTQ